MKIRFIYPTRYLEDGRLLKSTRYFFPQVIFPLLAALTPPGHDVSIVDELFEAIDFDEPVDLVGISLYTYNAQRGYEIADEYRRRGVRVAIGGLHVALTPREPAPHADAVFVGEAEETWPRFLRDLAAGNAAAVYEPERPPAIDRLPVPRYDLIEKYRARYVTGPRRSLARLLLGRLVPVQTARGCPHACEFCAVAGMFRGSYRPRPIPAVIDEIRALRAGTVVFIDDHLFADHARARDLFTALVPLRVRWVGQANVGAADDEDLLRLARRSGCSGLFVGLESISRASLDSVGKEINRVERYERQLLVFRKAGIDLDVSMMFGYDTDGPSVFRETHDFLVRNGVPFSGWQPLRPYPGTRFHERLKREGRLKDDRWWLNPGLNRKVFDLKFATRTMPEEVFRENLYREYRRFYSVPSTFRRILLRPQRRILFKLAMTLGYRHRLTKQTFITEY